MEVISKESLEQLRQNIDLATLLSAYIDLKKMGSYHKALCPFHDEKTPSFTVQPGSFHYHCFGCGAHGDAIEFLMRHQNLSFSDAVETLADRFHITLAYTSDKEKTSEKKQLISVMQFASRLYHYFLVKTNEGKAALNYLQERGIDLDFINTFSIGYAPIKPQLFQKTMMGKSYTKKDLIETGLAISKDKRALRDFFIDRIMFPIRDARGFVIAFSARKFHEKTYGGKYINSPETLLFKKSQALFGLNYARKSIAKSKRVLIVEGQIDALRLIQQGLISVVAPLGTAFTEYHVKVLANLGVEEAYLAYDSDSAGIEAQIKTGYQLQKKGINVFCLDLPKGKDPDDIVREKGIDHFLSLFNSSNDYLAFYYNALGSKQDVSLPAVKTRIVQEIKGKIQEFQDPIMVHESLKKLASLAELPESTLGVQSSFSYRRRPVQVPVLPTAINSKRAVETDLLYLLIRQGKIHPHFIELAKQNLSKEMFLDTLCYKIYSVVINHYLSDEASDILSLMVELEGDEEQKVLHEIMQKKVDEEKAETLLHQVLQKMLDLNWMRKREEIKNKIQGGSLSDDQALEQAKEFEAIKKNRPQVEELKD